MESNAFKVVKAEEWDGKYTLTFMNNHDPLPYSLYQCTYQKAGRNYTVNELLHYCIKNEEFFDIQGLYSNEFEQSMIHTLHEGLQIQTN